MTIKIYFMKKHKILVLLTLFLVATTFGSSLSRDLATNMGHLQELISKPISERVVNEEAPEYKIFTNILDSKNRLKSSVGAKALACLYFAWADDDLSREMLKDYAAGDTISGLSSFVGGAALYALTIRDIRERSYDEMKLLLSYRLGSVKNDFQRMFIANRLWVDYGEEALPVILLAASNNDHEFVMREYLYCLSQAEDADILEDALALDWPSGAAEIYDWVFVMSDTTPGRSTNALEYSPYALVKKMRRNLEDISKTNIE